MMYLRPTLFVAAAVMVTGCTGSEKAIRRTALDCPPTIGGLARASVATDGKTCGYTSASGDKVSLRLVPVATTPQAALTPIEQEVQALTPAASPANKAEPAAPAPPQSEDDEATEAGADEGGDRAQISLPGVHINADGDKAEVTVGSLHVDAKDGKAVIRQARDVRLKGEALAFERRGFRASYIVARDDLPGGYAVVGYEAGGPRKGPLTVAVVQMKGQHNDKTRHDVERLVRRNGGV